MFWTQAQWIDWKNGHRSADTTSAAEDHDLVLGFITDDNGQAVSEEVKQGIRKHARSVFRGMARDEAIGPMPATWARNCTPKQKRMFREEMEQEFSVLRYCADGWKSQAVAIECYSQYNPARIRKRKRGEEATAYDDLDTATADHARDGAARADIGPVAQQIAQPTRSSKKRKNQALSRTVIMAPNPL